MIALPVATALQLEQGFKNDDLAARHAFASDLVADFFVHCQAHGFVNVALRLIEIDPVDDLGFGRQFGGHLFLGAAQQKRFYPTVQVLKSDFAATLFNRHAVITVEAFHVTQPARQ